MSYFVNEQRVSPTSKLLATETGSQSQNGLARASHSSPLLMIHVLGEFRLDLNGCPLEFGVRTPIKSLDILRALAIAPNRHCAVENLYDWFWPDADGDQAKAACDQALHRLRRLLGDISLIVCRDGRVQLNATKIRVDLEEWEAELQRALRPVDRVPESVCAMERAFALFTGPLTASDRATLSVQNAAERVRGKFIELTNRLAQQHESLGNHARARAVYLRALDMYPTCGRCYESLIRGRLAQHDTVSAIEDYRRYERMLRATGHGQPSATIQALVNQAMAARPIDFLCNESKFAFA